MRKHGFNIDDNSFVSDVQSVCVYYVFGRGWTRDKGKVSWDKNS